jgi:HEAT repeat protein
MFALWIGSCLLALCSLLLMGALISVRSITGLRRGERMAAEKSARRALVSFASNPDEVALLEALKPLKPSIVSDQVQDVVGLVRGELVPRLRSVLMALNLQHLEIRRLRRALLPNRIRAAEFLGYFGDEKSAAVLERALKDRSSEVRVSAAIALARQGARLNLPVLLEGMSVSRAASNRFVDFFELVAKTDGPEVIALLDDPRIPPRIKALAIEGICRTKTPKLIDEVLDCLDRTDDALVRAAVIHGSALVRHRQTLDLVRANLGSDDAEIRLAAAEAAGLLGIEDEDVLDRLVLSMDDANWRVRFAASNALACLGHEGPARLRQLSRRRRTSARSIRASQLVLINVEARDV